MPGPATPAGPGKAALILILAALTALGPLSIDMYLPALPALSNDLSSSPSAIQLTLTACLTGLALGQVVAGPLSDLHGRRGATSVLIAVAARLSLWGLLPGLFLVVAAIGVILPTSTSMALAAQPRRTAGSASALLGVTQFAIGGVAAPLSGVAGPHTALPMGVVITVFAAAALATSLITRHCTARCGMVGDQGARTGF